MDKKNLTIFNVFFKIFILETLKIFIFFLFFCKFKFMKIKNKLIFLIFFVSIFSCKRAEVYNPKLPSEPQNVNFKANGQKQQVLLEWNAPNDGFTKIMIKRKTGDYPDNTNEGVNVYTGNGKGKQSVVDKHNSASSVGTRFYYTLFIFYKGFDRPVHYFFSNSHVYEMHQIKNFTALLQNGKAKLTWQNPYKIDFDGVEIRKITQNLDYNGIHTYPSNEKDGELVCNITDLVQTECIDENSRSGYKYYYRTFQYKVYGVKKIYSFYKHDFHYIFDIAQIRNLTAYDENGKIKLKWDLPLSEDGMYDGIEVWSNTGNLVEGNNYPSYRGDGIQVCLNITTETECIAEDNILENTYYYYSVFPYIISGNQKKYSNKFVKTKVGKNIQITFHDKGVGKPAIAWSGEEYAIVWRDNRDMDHAKNINAIYFTRLSKNGEKIGDDIKLTDSTISDNYPLIAWNGQEYGVTWYSSSAIYFTRLSRTGDKVAENIKITDTNMVSRYTSLVWNGENYAIAWEGQHDSYRRIYFAQFSKLGTKIGNTLEVTNENVDSRYPSLIWADDEYGLSWDNDKFGNKEIFLARISKEGNKIIDNIRVTNDANASSRSSITWNGEDYALAWTDNRDGKNDIYFTRITKVGSKIVDDINLKIDNTFLTSRYASLVWNGENYAVSFEHNLSIYFAKISKLGIKLVDKQITSTAFTRPTLIWTGEDYGMVWHDHTSSSNGNIYFIICE